MKKGTIFIANFSEFIEGKINNFSLYELIEIGKEEENPNTLFGTRKLLTFEHMDTNEKLHMFDDECCGKLEIFTSSIEKRLHSEFLKLQDRLKSINSCGFVF